MPADLPGAITGILVLSGSVTIAFVIVSAVVIWAIGACHYKPKNGRKK